MQDDLFGDLFNDLPTARGMRCIRKDLADRPIATVMDAERASEHYLAFMRGEITEETLDERLEDCILQRGMTKAEIEAEFPPKPLFAGQSDLSFHRTALIATIVWQEWQRVGQRRPKGNIRHFWYTHLMYTLTRVMRDTNIDSIEECYSRVLGQLVREEGFRYADLNLVSIKNKLCEAIFKDSPYPNIILACEKESYHTYLKRLAHLFHVTYISLGGQPSYEVCESLVFQFIEYEINLDQEFHILAVTDFDPHGYKIQEALKTHLERAGIRRVTLERVYLNPEHITPGIIERFAVPYEVKKGKDSTTKGACSLYNWFGAKTSGIYKRAGALVSMDRNGDGTYHVPQLTTGDEGYELYRVELDNFREDVLIQLLIDALERLVDGADYYYTAATLLWRQTIRQGTYEAAQALIQRAVDAKTQPVRQTLSDLRDRIGDRWETLTADEQAVIERLHEDADYQVESLQEQIDGIQEQIDALRDERDALERRQEAYRETEDDVIDFVHAVQRAQVPDIPQAQDRLEPIDEQLTTYGDEQAEAQMDAVRDRFAVDPSDIRGVVDCSSYAGTVFRQARAGAETFRAELSFIEQRRVTSAADEDLASQQGAMTVDVPDLPESLVTAIDTRITEAEALLAQADRNGEVPERWREPMRLLIRRYVQQFGGWNPWQHWTDGGWR